MSEAALYYDEKTCMVCGHKFSVLHPGRWAYKRGCKTKWTYFCSWRCLRAHDQMTAKERTEKKMGDGRLRLTKAQKEEAIQKWYEGGNKAVYEYLKSCGIRNEIKCWKNIQDRLKKIDPEEAKKLVMAKAAQKVKKIETPETVTLNGPVKIETPEGKTLAKIDVPAIPAAEQRYKYNALEISGLGEFYFDKKHGQIDWRTVNGEEISMEPAMWKIFSREIIVMLQKLGAD